MQRKGRIVLSKAGRDKDYFLAVVGAEGDYLLLADGKERPLERPKRKNAKHLAFTGGLVSENEMSTNRALRRALRTYAQGCTVKEEA